MSKKIVITIDIASGATSITDETGIPAQSRKLPMDGNDFGTIKELKTISVMATQKNPNCYWIYYNGQWHWVCE
jgi:Cu/Ag efflux pump CusA